MLACGLAGCSSDSAEEDESTQTNGSEVTEDAASPSEEEPKTAEVGEAIPVEAIDGDLNVTVEGFEDSNYMTTSGALSSVVFEGKHVGVLLLAVENVSYEYPDVSGQDHYVDLNPYVVLKGEDGVGISVMDTAIDYGEYVGAAGAFFVCPKGQSMHVALLYQIDPGTKTVVASIDGTDVEVPVTEGE